MTKLLFWSLIMLVFVSLPGTTWEDALKKLHPIWSEADWQQREEAFLKRQEMLKATGLSVLPFENVGPMAQGGRVMDLVMDERQPTTWLVAFATGGVWITHDDGHNWTSLFDNQAAFSIGSIAVDWGEPGVPKTIWVGTGEASNTRTVYMGAGLFKSEDQGKSWQRSALPNAQHIGRIAINPQKPGTVFVAALGPVYTDGGERGLYRTTNNGTNWQKVIDCPPFTGAVEILIDRKNPENVYACTWERRRKAWDFRENGPGSGLWKSSDGGEHFTRLSGGLPNGNGMGRIGLAQSFQNPNKIYALVDNQNPRPYSDENPKPLLGKEFLALSEAKFLKLSDNTLDNFLRLYGFPGEFSAESIRKQVKEKTFKFADMKQHVKGQEDIPYYWPKCIGPELYVSNDAGETWKKTHEADLRTQVDWGYGTATYYFGRIAVDPASDQHILICAVPLLKSEDGGKTFDWADEKGHDVHSDHHAILFDSSFPKRVLLGNDGGLNLSLDGGNTWRPLKNLPVGQCYTVTYDMSDPYRIFTGLQDNGISMGFAQKVEPYDQEDSWTGIWGADGMFVQVNLKDNNTVYLGTQFGSMSRLNLHTRKSKSIRPKPEYPKDKPFRTNWVTPIVMSKFHPDVVYTGTQFVHRSFDGGNSWEIISPNLTSEGHQDSFVNVGGNISYGQLSALSESSKRFGLLYAGTDEGWIWMTRDGGITWIRCTNGVPQNKWVTRLEPGSHEEGTVFATLTGFRENDTRAYVFKSTDFGKSWSSIVANLPNECMNVIRQDPVNPDLLYVGSDFGVYASLDGGNNWQALAVQIPNVPTYDLCVHPRDMDLIIGTYGRSVWVGSVKVLQKYSAEVRQEVLHLFDVDKQKASWWWEKEKKQEVGKPREVKGVDFFFHALSSGTVTLSLEDKKAHVLKSWELEAKAGLNRFNWDFQIDKKERENLPMGRRPFVLPGEYTLTLKGFGQSVSTGVEIEKPAEAPSWD